MTRLQLILMIMLLPVLNTVLAQDNNQHQPEVLILSPDSPVPDGHVTTLPLTDALPMATLIEDAVANEEEINYYGLISNAYLQWWNGVEKNYSGMTLSVMADEGTSSWGNFGMYLLSQLPRQTFDGNIHDAQLISTPWLNIYTAIYNCKLILQHLDQGNSILNPDGLLIDAQARSFAHFVIGISYGYLASYFDGAYVLDLEDLQFVNQSSQPSSDILQISIDHLSMVNTTASYSGTIPWINGLNLTDSQLRRLAVSYMIRYRIWQTRTPAERQALNWAEIRDMTLNAIVQDFVVQADGLSWWSRLHGLGQDPVWMRTSLINIGKYDISGNYDAWLALPWQDRDQVTIRTPDQRIMEQSVDGPVETGAGTDFKYAGSASFNISGGTYFRSYYHHYRWNEMYLNGNIGPMPHMLHAEILLYRAEALIRSNDNRSDAVDLINITRVDRGGLPPALVTDSDEELLEMIYYERGIELMNTASGLNYFDRRSLGRLEAGTTTEFPGVMVDFVSIINPIPFSVNVSNNIQVEVASIGLNFHTPADRFNVRVANHAQISGSNIGLLSDFVYESTNSTNNTFNVSGLIDNRQYFIEASGSNFSTGLNSAPLRVAFGVNLLSTTLEALWNDPNRVVALLEGQISSPFINNGTAAFFDDGYGGAQIIIPLSLKDSLDIEFRNRVEVSGRFDHFAGGFNSLGVWNIRKDAISSSLPPPAELSLSRMNSAGGTGDLEVNSRRVIVRNVEYVSGWPVSPITTTAITLLRVQGAESTFPLLIPPNSELMGTQPPEGSFDLSGYNWQQGIYSFFLTDLVGITEINQPLEISVQSFPTTNSPFSVSVKIPEIEPTSSLYGISFKISLEHPDAVFLSEGIEEGGIWGNENDYIGIYAVLDGGATVDVGLTKTDHLPLNGFGSVLDLSVLAQSPGEINFYLSDIIALTVDGDTINVTFEPVSVNINDGNIVFIHEFPYITTFGEVDNAGWDASGDWERGSPGQSQLTGSIAGGQSWMTALNDNYSNTDGFSILTTPRFDFSNLTGDIYLFFIHNFKTEPDFDGGMIEYSFDDVSWERLDPVSGSGSNFETNLSFNWYNNTSTNGLGPGGFFSGTSTAYAGHQNGWIYSETFLEGFNGASQVRFRFVFNVDDSVNDEGWAIDMFGIEVDDDDILPGIITRVNPDNGSTQVSVQPFFNWRSDPNADSYQIQVATTSSFNTLIFNTTTSDSFFASPSPLNFSTTYVWRVRGLNGVEEGPWNDAWSFTTHSESMTPIYLNNAPVQITHHNFVGFALEFTKDPTLSSINSGVVISNKAFESIPFTATRNTSQSNIINITYNIPLQSADSIYIHISADASSGVRAADGSQFGGNRISSTNIQSGDHAIEVITPLLGDYNADGILNVTDLNTFGQRWYNTSGIVLYDIGPATGSWPKMRPSPDGIVDFEDLMVLTMNWRKSRGLSKPAHSLSKSTASGAELDELKVVYQISDNANPYQPVSITSSIISDKYQNAMQMSSGREVEFNISLNMPDTLTAFEFTFFYDPRIYDFRDIRLEDIFGINGDPSLQLTYEDTDNGLVTVTGVHLSEPSLVPAQLEVAVIRLWQRESSGTQPELGYHLILAGGTELIDLLETSEPAFAEVPSNFELLQNYPNPFNPSTTIRYHIAEDANVKINIFDMIGRKVQTITEGSHSPGYYQVIWDASGFASGVYIYSLELSTPGGIRQSYIKKMTLVK